MQFVNLGGVIGMVVGGIAAAFIGRAIMRRFAKLPKDHLFSANLSRDTKCPVCGEPMPSVRLPRSLREALRGGWTCKRCGTECDKWGRIRKEALSGKPDSS